MKASKAELQTRLDWLKEQVAEYESKLAEPEKVGRWKPEDEDDYFYVDSDGEVVSALRGSTEIDQDRFAMGNVHQTREQAESARDEQLTRVKVLDRIVELNGDWVPDFNDSTGDKYTPALYWYGDSSSWRVEIDSWTRIRFFHPCKYVKSHEAAQTLIDEFTPEELATVYQ